MKTDTDISPEDLAELLAVSSALAGAARSEWEPACIARAFATPAPGTLAMTMQRWIDLEAARSPLLAGAEISHADLEAAAEIFAVDLDALSAGEIADVIAAMRRACAQMWSLVLPMREPGAGAERGEEGFGRWLPLHAALVVQCGLSEAEALGMRVDRACALLAADRYNRGWHAAGEPFAARRELATSTLPADG